jgi:methionyl-tRNA synthetase
MAEEKPIISYEDFTKLDLQIAKVVEASDHPNADKLIVMQIEFGGGERRQIIAGLKGWYEAADLLGKTLVVVKNLAPRKMRGLESQGMLLAASIGDYPNFEDVVVLTTDREVPPGSPVS